jgi:ABC-type enterochelin transport system ATPase subunit
MIEINLNHHNKVSDLLSSASSSHSDFAEKELLNLTRFLLKTEYQLVEDLTKLVEILYYDRNEAAAWLSYLIDLRKGDTKTTQFSKDFVYKQSEEVIERLKTSHHKIEEIMKRLK